MALWLDETHWLLVFPLALAASAVFGTAWAPIPAYLQAERGSHIVITTIMFDFIASALLVYMLALRPEGSRLHGAGGPHLRRGRTPAADP